MTGVVAQAVADLLDRSDERDLKDRMLQARRDGWLAGRTVTVWAGRQQIPLRVRIQHIGVV